MAIGFQSYEKTSRCQRFKQQFPTQLAIYNVVINSLAGFCQNTYGDSYNLLLGKYATHPVISVLLPLSLAAVLSAFKMEPEPRPEFKNAILKARKRKNATAWAINALAPVLAGLNLWANLDSTNQSILQRTTQITSASLLFYYWAMNWITKRCFSTTKKQGFDQPLRQTVSNPVYGTVTRPAQASLNTLSLKSVSLAMPYATVQSLLMLSVGVLYAANKPLFDVVTEAHTIVPIITYILSNFLTLTTLCAVKKDDDFTRKFNRFFRLLDTQNGPANNAFYRWNSALIFGAQLVGFFGSIAAANDETLRPALPAIIAGSSQVAALGLVASFCARATLSCYQRRQRKAQNAREIDEQERNIHSAFIRVWR